MQRVEKNEVFIWNQATVKVKAIIQMQPYPVGISLSFLCVLYMACNWSLSITLE